MSIGSTDILVETVNKEDGDDKSAVGDDQVDIPIVVETVDNEDAQRCQLP